MNKETRESINLPSGQSFRLLRFRRWQHATSKVEVMLEKGKSKTIPAGGNQWHYHPACELTCIHSGAGTRLVADEIELFGPNDLILVGHNVPHYWYFKEASSGLAIQWDLPLEHGIWNFVEAGALKKLDKLAKRGLKIRGRTAESVRNQMEGLIPLSGLTRLAAFLSILGEITEAPALDVCPISSKPFSLSGSAAHHEAMRKAVSYILANHHEPISLNDLLQLTNMSRATFARQFQIHAGKSFSSFLNEIRLRQVCKDLEDTAHSVSEIAFRHGFNQLSFFNRLFRRELKLTPSEYRNKNQRPFATANK